MPLPTSVLDTAARADLTEVTLGVRPESFRLAEDDSGLAVRVDLVEELGADAYVYGSGEINGAREQFVIRVDGRTPPRMGDTVRLSVRPGEQHVFHPQTGVRMG